MKGTHGFVLAPLVLAALVVMSVAAVGLTLSVKTIQERQQVTTEATEPNSCSNLINPSDCSAVPGCHWQAASCSDFTATNCPAGCTTTSCSTTPLNACNNTAECFVQTHDCSGFPDGACQYHGCDWQPPQMANCYLVNNGTACNAPGCTYIPGEPGYCSGGSWVSGGNCTGPGQCSTYEKPACQQPGSGCTWVNTYSSCSSLGNPYSCNQNGSNGCSWVESQAACNGTYVLVPGRCSGLWQSCDGEDACTGQFATTIGTCTGTPCAGSWGAGVPAQLPVPKPGPMLVGKPKLKAAVGEPVHLRLLPDSHPPPLVIKTPAGIVPTSILPKPTV